MFFKHLQNPIFSVLTALLFAFASSKFVAHFEILHFAFAVPLLFAVIFFSYVLISQKYEPFLHVIFFSIAIVIFYKALMLKPLVAAISAEDKIQNEVAILRVLKKDFEITTGRAPKNFDELAQKWHAIGSWGHKELP